MDLLNPKKWWTKIELSIAIAEWIEHFYNPERLHSSLGYVPARGVRGSTRSIHPDLTLTTLVRKTGSRSVDIGQSRWRPGQVRCRAAWLSKT